jgi:alpha-tubulin suppressor-like RCC1 family protein
VAAIAAGGHESLALTSTGAVYAWGDDTYGQLGSGTTTTSGTPAQVAGLSGVTAIAAGGSHTLALTGVGAVYAWGENLLGDLGATTTQTCAGGDACSTTPLQVGNLPSSIVAIAAGDGHSLALSNGGTVYAWGQNALGQLGNGSSDANAQPTPAAVSALSGVTAIATGSDHSLATVSAMASLSTTYINFGTQQIGTASPAQPISITNVGIVPMTITNATLDGMGL